MKALILATILLLLAAASGAGAQDYSPNYDVLVTSYPWIDTGNPGTAVSTLTTRCPEQSVQQCLYFKGQDTTAYGAYVVSLANTYGIDYISGFWQNFHNGTFDNFKAAFPTTLNLGRLRLVYMAGLLGFQDPAKRTVIENTLKSWRTDAADSSRYGYVTDTAGRQRPIIMIWGNEANGETPTEQSVLRQAFADMITRVRSYYNQIGLQPYIIMTEHGLWTSDDRIITSVDAFYQHETYIPSSGSTTSTWAASQSLAQTLADYRNQLVNKRASATQLPVGFIAGGMPSFDRTVIDQGHQTHGVVELRCRLQATEFYKMLRSFTNVAGLSRPITTLTSLNEWPEGSMIEPTMNIGSSYPAGNYGYDLVRGLRQVFGASTLSVNLGTTDQVSGLNRPPSEPSDGVTTAVTVSTTSGNVNLRMIEGTSVFAKYLYLQVDDNEIFDASEQNVTVQVTYADMAGWAGRSFWLNYDGMSNAYQNSGSVSLVGDNRLKSATLILSGVRLANRENNSSDLRIVAPPNTRIHIDKVVILKLTTARRTTNPCP